MSSLFKSRQLLVVGLAWTLIVVRPEPSPVNAADTEAVARVELRDVTRIRGDGLHNAFPGLARHGDYYYITFRQAQEHAGQADSKIIIVRSRVDDLKTWEQTAEFVRDYDSRDPLLVEVGPHLQVVWHSKHDWYSRSADGKNWTEPQLLDTDFPKLPAGGKQQFTSDRRWLFRIRRGPDGAYYSLARCGIPAKGSRGPFGLILYRSEDGIRFRALHTFGEGPVTAMAKIDAGGWGHEADIGWRADGSIVTAIRTREGIIAQAPTLAGPWTAFKTGAFDFGGPALHTTRHGTVLLAARNESEDRTGPKKMSVWVVGPTGLHHAIDLPMGGDGAYSSFVDGPDGDVLLVYYSGHERIEKPDGSRRPANIYLARLSVTGAGKQ